MTASAAPVSVSRLRFIDTARALAILLMLEGHFVDVTLAQEWRVSGNVIYEIWMRVRGLSAPMFFTVTGVIFSYLLSGAGESGFLHVRRVRRGLLRAAELLFWGYLLQADLKKFSFFSGGGPDPWQMAFHVLQCIAVGLLVMILGFGLLRRFGLGVLACGYFLAGLATFLSGVVLANVGGHLPQGVPEWLQNPIKGPESVFPLAPWLGFTLYGAGIGTLVRARSVSDTGFMSPALFLGAGLLCGFWGWWLDLKLGGMILDATGFALEHRVMRGAFHGRFGEILLILGVLVWLEKNRWTAPSWFQTIGRGTFPIYVGHVILLYGGIFGIGLNDWMEESLNPWEAVSGAMLFCGFFGLLAQFVEPLAMRCRDCLSKRRGGD